MLGEHLGASLSTPSCCQSFTEAELGVFSHACLCLYVSSFSERADRTSNARLGSGLDLLVSESAVIY